MTLQAIRKGKAGKLLSATSFFALLLQLVGYPDTAQALTGPNQPEVYSFTQVGDTEMVDLASGDFKYNIPLMDVGGYPINLTYHGGIGMDQDASWTGLGWNVNTGAIVRNKRGLPDDFDGDVVTKDRYMQPNVSVTATAGLASEIFGLRLEGLGEALEGEGAVSASLVFNNYNGVRLALGGDWSGSKGLLDANLGVSSLDGISFAPSFSFGKRVGDAERLTRTGSRLGFTMNSRQGLHSFNANAVTPSGSPEKKRLQTSAGAKSSFGSFHYTPSAEFPTANFDLSLKFDFGVDFFGIEGMGSVKGAFSRQALEESSIELPAYGYLHSDADRLRNHSILMDYNRENDGAISNQSTHLPVTNHTYDIFSISGHGVGGAFRAYRGDAGHVYEPKVNNTLDGSASIGLELTGAQVAGVGADIDVTLLDSKSGNWQTGNEADSKFRFEEKGENPTYEPYAFRMFGESTVDQDDFFKEMGGYEAVYFPVKKALGHLENQLENDDDEIFNPYLDYTLRGERHKRNQHIGVVTAGELATVRPQLTKDASAEDHHVAEFTVTRTDGARYQYGEAVYNGKELEVSFNIYKKTPAIDYNQGLVAYTPGDDDAIQNGNGRDHFYDRTLTPPYAHSYFLSSVLSYDYSDVDDNGPSLNDHGSYVKFSYEEPLESYQWRVPYMQDHATYQEGMKHDPKDDRATYLYGTKDIKYVKTIESKTHVAVFYSSPRKDGFEVSGQHGGQGTRSLHKLDSIALFARPIADQHSGDAYEVPLKVVHFVYDYSLCPGTPDNNGSQVLDDNELSNDLGRLSLKGVYFTYQGSFRGKHSPYQFNYNNDDPNQNPNYNPRAYDSWGNFQPNAQEVFPADQGLPNVDFPYTDQATGIADQQAWVYHLTGIRLPSGGQIKVDYEADDYAYVQDKEVLRMLKVIGATKDKNTVPTLPTVSGGEWPTSELYNQLGNNRAIWFDLSNDSEVTTDNFEARYIKTIKEEWDDLVYFNFLVQINQESKQNNDRDFERVSGYGKLIDWRYDSGSQMGCIVLKGETKNSVDPTLEHPVSLAAWNFIQNQAPNLQQKLLFGVDLDDALPSAFLADLVESDGDQIANESNLFEDVLGEFLGNVQKMTKLIDYFLAPKSFLKDEETGKQFVCNKSWIRLGSPGKRSKGGGCRVKKLSIIDSWDQMAPSGQARAYITNFSYEMEDGTSSGVATAESPVSKESPLVQPIYMEEKALLGPTHEYYLETPIGASFMPAPEVTYRRVVVERAPQYPGGVEVDQNETATGHTVHEFYTTYDFPTITDATHLDPWRRAFPQITIAGFGGGFDFLTASQGFVVIRNDMNGKPKAKWVYAEGSETPISGIEYKYKVHSEVENPIQAALTGTEPHFRDYLSNYCPVINPDGTVEEANIGLDYDIVADFRESVSHSNYVGLQGNLTFFMIFAVVPIPIFIPTAWPSYSYYKTQFRSATVTKVIQRYGVLEEVVTHDLGAATHQRNLAWDAETGEVLLTEVNNEYGDTIYNFTYPAHWIYDKMGPAYQNAGITLDVLAVGNELGEAKYGSQNVHVTDYLVKGDEVYLTDNNGLEAYGWVMELHPDSDPVNSYVRVIGHDGNFLAVNADLTLKVVRSARRNQQMNSAGSITLMRNPMDIDGDGILNAVTPDMFVTDALGDAEVVQASSQTFRQKWRQKICDLEFCVTECPYGMPPELGAIANPFVHGFLGNWRPHQELFYLGDRQQSGIAAQLASTLPNDPINTRTDGHFAQFEPYWQVNSGIYIPQPGNWTAAARSVDFDALGNAAQTRDALDRHSAAVYGYRDNYQLIVGNNARRNQLGFDNFEDYSDMCPEEVALDHFKFPEAISHRTRKEAHTGRYSVELEATEKIARTDDIGGEIDNFVVCSVNGNLKSPYVVDQCDRLSRFNPQTLFGPNEPSERGTYVFSYWIKRVHNGIGPPDNQFIDAISFTNLGGVTTDLLAGISPVRSKAIDGWVQVEYTFDIPDGSIGTLDIGFKNNAAAGSQTVWYVDDVRIHPFHSSVQSYVYDPDQYRLMAILDGNNYATLYEYDEEGKLQRVKRETDRGILTVQESLNQLKKTNIN